MEGSNHSKHSRKLEHNDGGEYKGKFEIPFSRASMREDSSESIGAGDVGNAYETSNDAVPSGHANPMGK